MSDSYPQLALAIVKGQEEIIGPVAWQQASTVGGLQVEGTTSISFAQNVDKKQVVEELVLRFRDFFGQAAVEVCKEAAAKVSLTMSNDELPASLR